MIISLTTYLDLTVTGFYTLRPNSHFVVRPLPFVPLVYKSSLTSLPLSNVNLRPFYLGVQCFIVCYPCWYGYMYKDYLKTWNRFTKSLFFNFHLQMKKIDVYHLRRISFTSTIYVWYIIYKKRNTEMTEKELITLKDRIYVFVGPGCTFIYSHRHKVFL